MCEDYRAGAYADFEHRQGRPRRRQQDPDADAGAVGRCRHRAVAAATPLDTWKNWATNVQGAPVDSGHFLTEETPDATAKALLDFFTA